MSKIDGGILLTDEQLFAAISPLLSAPVEEVTAELKSRNDWVELSRLQSNLKEAYSRGVIQKDGLVEKARKEAIPAKSDCIGVIQALYANLMKMENLILFLDILIEEVRLDYDKHRADAEENLSLM